MISNTMSYPGMSGDDLTLCTFFFLLTLFGRVFLIFWQKKHLFSFKEITFDRVRDHGSPAFIFLCCQWSYNGPWMFLLEDDCASAFPTCTVRRILTPANVHKKCSRNPPPSDFIISKWTPQVTAVVIHSEHFLSCKELALRPVHTAKTLWAVKSKDILRFPSFLLDALEVLQAFALLWRKLWNCPEGMEWLLCLWMELLPLCD